MNAHEHTDPHGDGLTITHDGGKVWITCTTAHAEVTVGPLAPGVLAGYDMDGGVAAALIEKEVEQPDAEVRELRSALARELARGNALQDALDAAEPRPLTPDAITDEARARAYRAVAALSVCDWDDMSGVAKGRAMALVEAVVTEITRPELPARPEGAEDVAVRLFQAGAAVGVEMTAEQRDALADHLAAMRVRVVGEDGAA